MATPMQAGVNLGQLLFGTPDDGSALENARLKAYSASNAMEMARKNRAEAIMAEGRNDAIGGLGGQLGNLGFSADQAPAAAQVLQAGGGNADQLTQALGNLLHQGYQGDARTAALGGDLNAANANLFGVAKGPVDLTKVSDGVAYNPVATPDQTVNVTPLGEAAIGLRNAQAGKDMFQGAIPNGDGTTSAGFIDPTSRTFRPLTMGGDGTTPVLAPGLGTLAQDPYVTMTSGVRTAQHNADVGGVPDSQHLAGTAADYVVPPADKPAFTAQAQKLGYQVLDEGTHLHVQLPHGAAAPQGLGSLANVSGGIAGGAATTPAPVVSNYSAFNNPPPSAPPARLPFGTAPAKAGAGDTFAKNKAFADQLQASGAISTPEEYKQVLTTGKVQQSESDVPLSPADEQAAQMMSRYQIRPNSLSRGKSRTAVIARAGELNPDFQEANANAAYDYIKDLSKSGTTSAGGRVTSINAALQHLDAMMDANKDLSGSSFTPLNAIGNELRGATGQAAINNYNLSLHLLSQEVAKLLKGGVPDVFDTQGIIKNMGPNASPEQRNGGMATLATFLEGQINSTEERGANVLGAMDPGTSLMTAKSQDAVRRAYELGGKTPPDMRPPAGLTGYIRKLSQHSPGSVVDPGAASSQSSARHRYSPGDKVTVRGTQYRVTGGDPYDPDMEAM